MSINHSTSVRSSTEARALELLGSGLSAETVATACGVSVSRISQLLSDPEFAAGVSELRFGALQKHNARDSGYDDTEDKLLAQFKSAMPMLFKPMEILKAMQVMNAMKRRGQSAPEAVAAAATIVTITMPTKIVQNFVTNAANQVVSAGTQELLTMQSGSVAGMAAAMKLQEGVRRLNSREGAENVTNTAEFGCTNF